MQRDVKLRRRSIEKIIQQLRHFARNLPVPPNNFFSHFHLNEAFVRQPNIFVFLNENTY